MPAANDPLEDVLRKLVDSTYFYPGDTSNDDDWLDSWNDLRHCLKAQEDARAWLEEAGHALMDSFDDYQERHGWTIDDDPAVQLLWDTLEQLLSKIERKQDHE